MKCSKCDSTRCKRFKNATPKGGYVEGIRCMDCGHTASWYVKPDKEKLASNISYHFVERMKRDEF